MAEIHATAIVDPTAKIADSARIGPYCVVGPEVVIGEGTEIPLNHLGNLGYENTFVVTVYTKPGSLGYKESKEIYEHMNDTLNAKRLGTDAITKLDIMHTEKSDDKRMLFARYRTWYYHVSDINL